MWCLLGVQTTRKARTACAALARARPFTCTSFPRCSPSPLLLKIKSFVLTTNQPIYSICCPATQVLKLIKKEVADTKDLVSDVAAWCVKSLRQAPFCCEVYCSCVHFIAARADAG